MSPFYVQLRRFTFNDADRGRARRSCSRPLSRFLSGSIPRARARYIGQVTDRLLLITLLVKLGVVASVASVLARASTFRHLLFAEKRRTGQTIGLLAFFLVPLTIGVYLRFLVPNFLAADISFEATVLLGLLVGPYWALLSGAVLSVPAMLHHEYLALPFNAALGLAAGLIGRFVERQEIWSFTPFIDLSLYRWVRRNIKKPRIDRQILLLFLIAALEMARDWIAHEFPHRLFALEASKIWLQALVWLSAPIVVGIALKVWNALRLELSLEEQKRLVLEARLDALQRQINPHFLFNTLNSIASLVRSQPEMAREMTVKLANILRALLKDHDTYVPFSQELRFTDDYLDIEVVRFGADKLRVEKEIDPRTLSIMVPSILLQPLIENSIKHGLEPRIRGGTVTLRSKLTGGRVLIEVADDGVGISERPASALKRTGAGIGIKNVRERLEVLYGDQAHFTVVSNPGRGTLVSIEIPADLAGGE
jgi:two-component system LytT family sensor kinase